jgi:WXG100 family type VII secretion target
MTMLVVDFSQLRAAIDHMASFEQQVTDCLDDVEHTMALLRATWHGDASDAQTQSQQQWDAGAEQMKKALEQLKTIAQTAHQNYSDAVSKNGQMWG